MRRAAVAVCLLALASGCVSSTSFGPCVGLSDEKDPKLTYKVSERNLVVGIIFSELIVPPVIVAIDEFYCPIARKP